MAMFEELKRRKVFRVGAAYVVVAWLAIQAVSIAFPAFDAPPWMLRVFILVCLLGFPITLVMAWAFESTPEGIAFDAPNSGSKRLYAVATVLTALALAWYFYGQPSFRKGDAITPAAATDAAPTAAPAPTAAVPAKSIAVLPFENLSDDKANAYFADGMQDMILTRLAGIGDLKVISRTSTEKYKSRPENLRAVAAELGVATLLEGSVQKAGNSVLINVQLIDANTDAHLWAEAYTRTLDNVFDVEGEVAQKVADALKATLTAAESASVARPPTQNAAAYDAFLKAEYLFGTGRREMSDGGFRAAEVEYRRAIALDPDFALAYAERAYARLNQHWFGTPLTASELAEVKASVDTALRLAPDLPAAHVALGYYHYWGFRQYDQANAAFEAAQKLAPSNAESLAGLAYVARRTNRLPQALAYLAQALTLSPRDVMLRTSYAETMALMRRYPAAVQQFQLARALQPADANLQDLLHTTQLFGIGSIAAARAAYEPPPPWRLLPTNLTGDVYFLVNPRIYPDVIERNFDAALKAWDAVPLTSDEERRTARVARVAIRLLAGQRAAAQDECRALRPILQAARDQAPDSLAVLQQVSWVDLCLGDNDDAIAAARRAADQLPLSKDSYFGAFGVVGLAQVCAFAHDPDCAFAGIEQLLQRPTGTTMSVTRLNIDPVWDPLRSDPRFAALLRKYAAGPALAGSDR